MTNPTQTLDLERMRDDELAEIALHAGMTAEQDDRHKAIFFDSYVLSLLDALSSERAAREDAEGEREAAERRSLENNMLAHRWMVAHDARNEGKPYTYPNPADLPKSEARALAAEAQVSALQAEAEESYAIGKRDGYDEAIQALDLRTGGDGEYRFCTDADPDRHMPDAAHMSARIISRFEAVKAQVDGLRDVGVLQEALERAWRDCGDMAPHLSAPVINIIGRHMAHHIPEVAREFSQPPADEPSLDQAMADHERTMREEVIPRINADLRQQALLAERLRRGLPPADEAAKGEE